MKSIHKPYALKTKKIIIFKNCREFKSFNVIHNNCHMRLSTISSFPAVFPAGIATKTYILKFHSYTCIWEYLWIDLSFSSSENSSESENQYQCEPQPWFISPSIVLASVWLRLKVSVLGPWWRLMVGYYHGDASTRPPQYPELSDTGRVVC